MQVYGAIRVVVLAGCFFGMKSVSGGEGIRRAFARQVGR